MKIVYNKKRVYIVIVLVVILLIIVYFTINNFKDTCYTTWESEYMQYEQLHNYSTGSSQTIALIDSGASKNQNKLVNKEVNLTDEKTIYDSNGHGTIMVSIIKGDKESLCGIAPDCKINMYKVMDESGKTNVDDIVTAVNNSIKDNVTIINLSLGSYKDNIKLDMALKKAIKEGITVVSSSGDYSSLDMLYPAKLNYVVSVGALQKDKNIWDGTNAKDECDALIPGVDITSISKDGKIEKTTGTSQATALESGYLALIKDYCYKKNISIENNQLLKLVQELSSGKLTYTSVFEKIGE